MLHIDRTGPFPYQYNQSTGAISFDPTFLKAQLHTLLKTMPAHIHVPAHLNPETVDSYIEHLRVSYNAAADSVHVQIDGIPIVKSTQFDLCHSQNCVTHTNSPRPSSSH
ncbi:hypothetical protein Pelo_2907 [Pelomyxa schiedti]|nr:hypothetical protein Pelo_2907 [Pelomyxa schiedti]